MSSCVQTKTTTLVLIMDEAQRRILLGMKKRGFGAGWWNGFGGKVQPDETIEECAKRETQEECGLVVTSMYQIGRMSFEFVDDPVLLDVHVFYCDAYTGNFAESEEMLPRWFAYDNVPYTEMWPDDVLWYPYLFKKQKFKANFLFQGHTEILKHSVEVVQGFDET